MKAGEWLYLCAAHSAGIEVSVDRVLYTSSELTLRSDGMLRYRLYHTHPGRCDFSTKRFALLSQQVGNT